MLNNGDKQFGFVAQSLGGPKSTLTYPLQPEAAAYIAAANVGAMDFIDAVNSFVYRIKALGGSFGKGGTITDLYLVAADNQQSALINFTRDNTRVITITSGTPVFTKRKGYDFSSGAQLSLPFDTSLTAGSLFFFGGWIVGAGYPANYCLFGTSTATLTTPGSIVSSGGSNGLTGWSMGSPVAQNSGIGLGGAGSGTGLAGSWNIYQLTPSGVINATNGTLGGYSAIANPLTGFYQPGCSRFSIYGAGNGLPTLAKNRQLLRVVQQLLDDLGALD